MKNQRLVIALSLFNFGLLLFSLFHEAVPVKADSPEPILRARGLEIVDEQGRVRAAILIQPEGPARKSDGSVVKGSKTYPETVLFRLIRPDGRPSVKISTSQQGSAVSLGGGQDPTYIVMAADGGDPSLSLTNGNGHLQTIKP